MLAGGGLQLMHTCSWALISALHRLGRMVRLVCLLCQSFKRHKNVGDNVVSSIPHELETANSNFAHWARPTCLFALPMLHNKLYKKLQVVYVYKSIYIYMYMDIDIYVYGY